MEISKKSHGKLAKVRDMEPKKPGKVNELFGEC